MPKHTHKYTLTTMDNIISPIHIYCRIVFGLWGKPKHPEETHTDKERTPGSVGAQTEDLPTEPLIETYTDCKWRSQPTSQNLTAVICYFRHAVWYTSAFSIQPAWMKNRMSWKFQLETVTSHSSTPTRQQRHGGSKQSIWVLSKKQLYGGVSDI